MGAQMAKFMLSLRDESFKLLVSEAEDRGISIQELIRAVIIPDWVKQNTVAKATVAAAGTPGNGNGNGHTRTLSNGIFQPTSSRVRG